MKIDNRRILKLAKGFSLEFDGARRILLKKGETVLLTYLHDVNGMKFLNLRGLFNFYKYTKKYTENSPYVSRYEFQCILGNFYFMVGK